MINTILIAPSLAKFVVVSPLGFACKYVVLDAHNDAPLIRDVIPCGATAIEKKKRERSTRKASGTLSLIQLRLFVFLVFKSYTIAVMLQFSNNYRLCCLRRIRQLYSGK